MHVAKLNNVITVSREEFNRKRSLESEKKLSVAASWSEDFEMRFTATGPTDSRREEEWLNLSADERVRLLTTLFIERVTLDP